MKSLIFTMLTFCLSSSGYATTESAHDLLFSERPLSSGVQPGIFTQKIDHGSSVDLTFNQRYWINSTYAKSPATAPVIYHICGEGAADEGYFLRDNAVEWAKALGAHIVYLEHRYYGKSIPVPDLAAPNMQFLTLNNVMEDLSTFQKWIAEKNGWNGKWIVVGGSYSGTLAALYRQKYPELVVGALAASAPMIPGKGELVGDESFLGSLSSSAVTDDRSWVYQACRDFDFWEAQGGSFGSPLMRPNQWLCTTLFGNIPLVSSNDYNERYNKPFISAAADAPSKILFTYGGNDVWTELGLSQEQNLNPQITIEVIPNAGHHFDLNAPTSGDNAGVLHARQTFLTLAKTWLK